MSRKPKKSVADVPGVAGVRKWRKSLMRDAGGTVRGLMNYLDSRSEKGSPTKAAKSVSKPPRKRKAA